MVLIAVVVLNFFHPAFCFMEGVDGLGGLGSMWGSKMRPRHKTAGKNEDTSSA